MSRRIAFVMSLRGISIDLQVFRMREFVRIGSPDAVATFREQWMKRADALALICGYPSTFDRASDPFFGRVGQLMAANQVEAGAESSSC